MFDIDAYFDRHEKVALHFSSGKDSALCLYELKKYWDKITVVWCNQGDPYQETVDYMAHIKSIVPHFVEVMGTRKEAMMNNIWPVDVVPLELCADGRYFRGTTGLTFTSAFLCCRDNFWLPLATYTKENGFTGVIRGQRDDDTLKQPINSGDVIDGIEFLLPIQFCSEEEVTMRLGNRLPESYKRDLPSSLDCKTCTAYVDHNKGRITDLQKIDPLAASIVIEVHNTLRTHLMKHINNLEEYK